MTAAAWMCESVVEHCQRQVMEAGESFCWRLTCLLKDCGPCAARLVDIARKDCARLEAGRSTAAKACATVTLRILEGTLQLHSSDDLGCRLRRACSGDERATLESCQMRLVQDSASTSSSWESGEEMLRLRACACEVLAVAELSSEESRADSTTGPAEIQ